MNLSGALLAAEREKNCGSGLEGNVRNVEGGLTPVKWR